MDDGAKPGYGYGDRDMHSIRVWGDGTDSVPAVLLWLWPGWHSGTGSVWQLTMKVMQRIHDGVPIPEALPMRIYYRNSTGGLSETHPTLTRNPQWGGRVQASWQLILREPGTAAVVAATLFD